MNLEQYERKIEKWFSVRGLEKASPYKQAGNSVTVNVIKAIAERLE